MAKHALLIGDGTQQSPWHIRGFRNEEFRSINEAFSICEREGIERLNVAYSGRYYILKDDGWYHTSDSESCDKVHFLPPEGKRVRGRREGFSPINGEGRAMVKKNKAWSMPEADWQWLETQSNQSKVLRDAIANKKKESD
jgi:hypothetical protein